MSTISLCMIVKNEEDVLERCLNSVKELVDEIIIVDTGSTDSTKQIALKHTNKVFDFTWQNDFSLARNYSFSLATKDYIMWLDADDIITPHELQKLLKLKPQLCADTYMLKYATGFMNNKPSFSFFRERILKRSGNPTWEGCVHECIAPYGKIERRDITIEHRKIKTSVSNRNINIYKQILKTRQLTPRESYYYGRELFDHKKYKKCINVLRKFINSNLGWIENVIDAYFLISECYLSLNLAENSLDYLFKTFSLDAPRANVCCKIGDYFLLKNKYEVAIYWYVTATKCKDVTIKGGFVDQIYYNYYPFLQLCKAYYSLGNVSLSKHYNMLAEQVNPKSEIVMQNKLFFERL